MAASPKDRPVGNPLRAAASDDYSTLENEGDTGSARRRRRSRWMLALAVITACCVGSALAVIFRKDVLRACYRIGQLPPVAGGLLFSALLALWLTCLLPTSLLEIAAGYVFGFAWATLWSTAGKVAGSVLSYWIGRCAPVWKSKFYGAFVLDRRVVLHAIDATHQPRHRQEMT